MTVPTVNPGAGGTASTVRIVATLVSRFASRPALVCWHAATVDVRHLFEVFGAGGIAREEPLKLPQRPRKRQPRVLVDVHENQRGRFHTRSPLSGNRVQGIAPIASGFRPYSQTNTTPGGCMRQPDNMDRMRKSSVLRGLEAGQL